LQNGGGVVSGRGGVFRATTEGGRSFMSLFVFENVRIVGVTGENQYIRVSARFGGLSVV